MDSKSHLARCAGSAIAAALALGSTPVLAQDVAAPAQTIPAGDPAIGQPVLQLPVAPVPVQQVNTAPSAAPQIVLPAQNPAMTTGSRVVISEPVVQQVPVAPEPQASPIAAPRVEAPPIPAATQARLAPAPASVPAPETFRINAEPPLATAEQIEPIAGEVQAPVMAPQAILPAQNATSSNEIAETAGAAGLILSALAILGLAILAFIGLRRRRKFAAVVPKIERPVVGVANPPKLIATDPVKTGTVEPRGLASASDPVSIVNKRDIREWAQPVPSSTSTSFSQMRDSAGGLPHAGAAIALPRHAPKDADERSALLRRMIAAKPDRANPFRTRKARLHRARLILQSLDRTFENGKSSIDLSQYPMNWPELAKGDQTAVA